MTLTTEQVQSFFHAHWTVRKYKNFAMPPEHLNTILEAAQRAPTDATAQMYSFIRLSDPVFKKKIAELSTNAHIETASEAFVICADVHRLEAVLKTAGHEMGEFPHIAIHFAIGDAVMAAQNMLVAAEMLGYRGCWIGGVISAPEEISEVLKLPAGVFPFAAMTIGIADEPAQHRPRLPRPLVIHENTYQTASSEDLQKGIQLMGPITARGDWAQTLARYFAKDGSMEVREKKLSSLLKKAIFRK